MNPENLSKEEQDLILQDIDTLTWGTNQESEEDSENEEASSTETNEESQADEENESEASDEWDSKADKVKKLLAQRNAEKKEKEALAERVKALEASIEQDKLDKFLNKYPQAEKLLDKIEIKLAETPWLTREEAYILVWGKKLNPWTNMWWVWASITEPKKQAKDMTMDELQAKAWQEIERQLAENGIF